MRSHDSISASAVAFCLPILCIAPVDTWLAPLAPVTRNGVPILWGLRVTSLAILPLLPPPCVFASRDRLHMVGIDTATILAEMINRHPSGDIPLKPVKHQSVGVGLAGRSVRKLPGAITQAPRVTVRLNKPQPGPAFV